jgi:hypothetical protein
MRRALASVLLLLVCSAVLGATVFREQVAEAAQAILPVRVVNTSADPVPVSGTVAINGTAAVEVADERTPFEIRVDADIANEFFGSSGHFTVPDGKRLVVEFISVSVRLPPGQVPSVSVNADSGARGFAVPLEFQGTDITSVGTSDRYIGALNVLDFADAGDFYSIAFRRTSSAVLPPGTAHMFAFVSGYLVDE